MKKILLILILPFALFSGDDVPAGYTGDLYVNNTNVGASYKLSYSSSAGAKNFFGGGNGVFITVGAGWGQPSQISGATNGYGELWKYNGTWTTVGVTAGDGSDQGYVGVYALNTIGAGGIYEGVTVSVVRQYLEDGSENSLFDPNDLNGDGVNDGFVDLDGDGYDDNTGLDINGVPPPPVDENNDGIDDNTGEEIPDTLVSEFEGNIPALDDLMNKYDIGSISIDFGNDPTVMDFDLGNQSFNYVGVGSDPNLNGFIGHFRDFLKVYFTIIFVLSLQKFFSRAL